MYNRNKGEGGGNSHLLMVAMSSPTESQWDVMQSRSAVGLFCLVRLQCL